MKSFSEIIQERKECKEIQRERAEQHKKAHEESLKPPKEDYLTRVKRIMESQKEIENEKYFDIFDLYWYVAEKNAYGTFPKLNLAYKKNETYYNCRTGSPVESSNIFSSAFKFKAPHSVEIRVEVGNFKFNCTSVKVTPIYVNPETQQLETRRPELKDNRFLERFGFSVFYDIIEQEKSNSPNYMEWKRYQYDKRRLSDRYVKQLKYISTYDNELDIALETLSGVTDYELDAIESGKGDFGGRFCVMSNDFNKMFEKPKICVSMTGVIKAEDELNRCISEKLASMNKAYASSLDARQKRKLEREKAEKERCERIAKIQDRIV